MSEDLQLGVQLLLIGMTSVFVILSIVVGLGRGIIAYSNTLASLDQGNPHRGPRSADTSSDKIAVISAVIDHLTGGKGQVGSIEEL